MEGVEYESQDAFRKRMRFFEEVDARFANAYAVHADTDVQDDDEDEHVGHIINTGLVDRRPSFI